MGDNELIIVGINVELRSPVMPGSAIFKCCQGQADIWLSPTGQAKLSSTQAPSAKVRSHSLKDWGHMKIPIVEILDLGLTYGLPGLRVGEQPVRGNV